MSEEIINSDDSYSDDEEEEELDPRIQDELEKLNAATNSINHLEAELDEARAVFRQTLAGATYHLNAIAQKLGKCVEKSRPFYESYRQLRQSHGMLQKSTNQFERATGMHLAARTRVLDAENRVFGGGSKRAFDAALQEMLNQATIEVNEAEKLKRESWKQHQEDLKAYRDLELKVKKLYKKLKSSVDKSKPYFEQKKEFDRHLWQLKLRVDSILLGLSGAKENYSACLKSLEVISDEIHEKRKSKRMEMMLSKLQEREAGVGADSSTEDETSLSASNLDLDFDSSLNFDKLDSEQLTDNLTKNFQDFSTVVDSSNACCVMSASMDPKDSNISVSLKVDQDNTQNEVNNPPSADTRVVYGLEAKGDESITSILQAKDEVEKIPLMLDKSQEESKEESYGADDRSDNENEISVMKMDKELSLTDNAQENLNEDAMKTEDSIEKGLMTDKAEEFAVTVNKVQDHDVLEKEITLHDPEQVTQNEELKYDLGDNDIKESCENTSQENDKSVEREDSQSIEQQVNTSLSLTHSEKSTQEVCQDKPSFTEQSNEKLISINSEARKDKHEQQIDVRISPENDTQASVEKDDHDDSTADESAFQE